MKLLKGIGGFIVLSGPLFFLLVYFIIAVVLSIIAARQGAKRGKKRWGLYTALVFILIMFWDLPLVLGTRWYQCTNNAGFTVHKTLEQWQQANPGVAETLIPSKVPEQYLVKSEQGGLEKFYRLPDGMEIKARFWKGGKSQGASFKRPDGTKGYWLNQRFIWETFYTGRNWQGIGSIDERIIDSQTGQVMAQYIDFNSSPTWSKRGRDWNPINPQNLKFWLAHGKCPKGEFPNPQWLVDGDSFISLKKKFKHFDGEIQ